MNNLPFHADFSVTAIYGQKGSMWSLGFHTGIDLVSSNKTIYATCNGTVYSKGFSNAYGNNVFIYDETNKYYHHFCHLESETKLEIGQAVTRETIIGTMGASGNVTGPHLHYELMINNTSFLAENFIDPCIWVGIPNKVGEYKYSDFGEPVVPDPPINPEEPIKKKHKYKFVLFKRKY